MSTITLPNIRVGSDLQVRVRLKDGGVAIDWSTLQNIKACIYSDAQRALAGRCAFSIDEEDNTLLVCTYAANKPQYLGVNRIVISAKYMGETKTYDKPAFTFVRWTADQEGEEITIDDPDVDVEIDVEDISSSILQEAVDAAFTAADRANDAAAAAEHMVDIHTGPEGKSAYEVAVEEGYTGTEEEWLASLKGDTGETPDISIGTVTTVAPGTPASASMTGTPEEPVLNLSIPQGVVGATPNFTVGTVTTGEPGSSVIVTITGTPEAPVLNLTIPQGMQGNTGSSVEFPYELVNNLTTNDATKGLSAAQGVVLDGKVSQLEAKVTDLRIGEILLDGGIFNESYSTNANYTWQNKGSVFKLFAGVSYEFHISCPTGQYPLYVRLRDLVSGTNIYDTSIGASSTGRVLVYCPQSDTEVCILFGGAESRAVTISVTNNQVAVQSSLLESKNEISAQMYEKTSVQGVEYELGNIAIGGSWTYTDDERRVRTLKNYTIHLFPGDVIGLSDYTDARFYWGCRDLSGAYTSGGWKTSDLVVVTEGYYVLCISNRTDTTQTSARELGELIQITRNTTLGKLFDKVIKNELKIAGGAYGVHQEFPTIAGKKYIVGIPEQEWSVSNFGANEVAFVVRTKSGSTYTDIAATRIYVRTFGSLRNTYTFEAATGISDIFIRANSGQTITFYVAEEDTPSVIGNYCQVKKLRTEADNSMVVSLPFGRYLYHHNVESPTPIIPSQSLYDIAYAKALGFKAIEGNIQKCSDGVFVIKHGANGGKLGAGLSFAEGSGLSADTLFSSITSTELRQNVTYASTRAKYRGHIPTLAEFCQECARIGIAPFLRGADESVLAEARKYLPDEQIIIEWGLPRKDFKGLMTMYDGGATSADILAKCKAKGRPFYYCWSSADTASESLFSEVAETLHQNGYVLAATYLTQNNFQRLRKIGLDMAVPTSGIIPPFYNGNVLNIVSGNDENLILSGASYNSQDKTIEMNANGTISIVNEKMGAFLSKVCIRLRYSGTLSVSFTSHGSSANLVSWESDGEETIELAIATSPGNNIVTILADEATTIYDIAIFGSVVM